MNYIKKYMEEVLKTINNIFLNQAESENVQEDFTNRKNKTNQYSKQYYKLEKKAQGQFLGISIGSNWNQAGNNCAV